MNKVFYNKKYYFFRTEGGDFIIPFPGDILLEIGKEVNQICSQICFAELLKSDNDEISLELEVFGKREWAIGTSGKKVYVATVKSKKLSLSNINDFKIIRGTEVLFPISFKYKVINFFYRTLDKIKNIFKK
jgi:hypothetical protein